MKKNRVFARIFSVLLAAILIVTCSFALPGLSAKEVKAAGNVTRAEWLKKLVETFDMTVEDDNYPDNYFADLDEDSDYYYDMLVAVQFGLINVEAGGNMYPEDGVTREFAASTLNYCLGFIVEEDAEYSFSDTDAVTDKAAAEIAVKRNWFSLIDGEFSPERYITVSEENAMLADAKEVWDSTTIDENHEDTYELKDGIKEIPEDVEAYVMDDGSIYIESKEIDIAEGDKVAVHLNGIPCVYHVDSAKNYDDGILISGEEVAIDEAFDDIDIQGTLDASAFISTDEDAEVSVTDEDNLGGKGSIGLKSSKVNVNKSFAGVSFNMELTNMKLEYKTGAGESFVKLTADTKMTVKGSVSAKKSVTIYANEIPGIGGLNVSAEVGGSASVTGTTRGKISVGVAKYSGTDIRAINEFSSKGFEIRSEAEVGAGITARLGLYGEATPFHGFCYVKVGARASVSSATYSSGKPSNCSAFVAYVYAEAGAEVSFKLGPITIAEQKYTYPIYTDKNSPIRVVHHYEDGREVPACTREGDFIAATGHSPYAYFTKYGSRYWGSGLYGYDGNYGLDGEGKPVIIWEYELDEDENATITKYSGNARDLTVPDTIDGHKVIALGANSFKENKALVTVVIPDTVLTIGSGAFLGCSNLSYVTLSKNVVQMDAFAFGYCNSLTSIEIPKSLVKTDSAYYPGYIYNYQLGPFINSNNLKEVTFEKGCTVVANGLFANNQGIENITLPDSVTEIGSNAFSGSANLKHVDFSSGLTKINSDAFYGCKSLSEAIIPDSVTEILGGAFCACSSLSDVHLPKALTKLGGYAFGDCDSLTAIEIPKSLKETTSEYKIEYIYNYHYGVFIACDNLKNITFEEGITSIPNGIFANNDSIESITIPDTVLNIGWNAFESAKGLKEVKLSNSLLKIESNTFMSCWALEKIVIPDSVTQIDSGAFLNCKKLSEVTLSKKLKTIGAYAFGDCDSLTSIEIPKSIVSTTDAYYYDYKYGYFYGVFIASDNLKNISFEKGITTIPNGLFAYNEGIEKVTIPDTVEVINDQAFRGCKNLAEVTLSKNLTKMNYRAFEGTAIEKLSIPDTVTYIGDHTFTNCDKMTEATISKNISKIESGTFEGCTSLKNITIPEKVTELCEYSFSKTGLEKIEIPKNVITIGAYAFYKSEIKSVEFKGNVKTLVHYSFAECNQLEKVTIPDSITSMSDQVFYKCEKLTDVNLGSGITVIPKETFYANSSLKKIVLPMQINTIGSNSFANCTSLTDITINRNVTTIYKNAFSYPDKLTIHGVSGTYAETFAKENDIKFVPLTNGTKDIILQETSIRVSNTDHRRKIYAVLDPLDTADEFTWSSTDDDICKVENDGSLTPWKVGEAQLIAMSGDVIKTVDVTVYNGVSDAFIDQSWIKGGIGEEKQLTYTIYPSNAEIKTVKWYSSDEKVASVDSEGKVKLLSYGKAVITLISDDMNKSDTCEVTVEAIPVTGVTLDKKVLDMTVGDSYTLTPTIAPENATNKKVTWTSTKPAVVTVDENGKLTAVSVGSSVIICKTEDGAKTATCTVTVEEGEHTHKWDDGVITKEPSCTEEGIRTYSCSCGESYTEKVDALGHDEITVDEVPASCTEDGFTSYTKCSRCEKILTQGKVIKAKGHLWDNGEVVKEATETEDGLKRYKCKNCEATNDVVIPAGGEEPYDPVYVEEFVGIEDEMNVGDQLEISATLNRNLEPGETFEWVINDLLDVDGNEIEGEPEGTGKYATIDENGILKATGAGMISVSCKINGEDSYYSYYVEIFGSQDAPSAIEVEEVTDTTITVKDIDWCEYSIDGVEWQYSPCFLYLEPDTTYTVYMRRMASGYLLASEPCSLTVTTEKSEEPVWPFKDLSKDSPIAEEVLYAYEHGIANGFGVADENGQVNFKPERKVTRAQFAIMVYGMAGKPSIKGINTDKYTYSDVPSTAGCYSAVVWASSHGIISGYPNGKFKPESNISRSQIAMMLKRFADYKDFGYMYETGGQDIKSFADYGEVKANAESDLQWALDNGIISGITSTKLKPNGDARRDQCAAFCARFYKAFIE